MKHLNFKFSLLFLVACLQISCNMFSKPTIKNNHKIKNILIEKNISYSSNQINMNGFAVYDENSTEKKPAVLIVPEWWGLNEYTKSRTRQFAQLGYVAMAMDMYGNGEQANNPTEAQKLATPFYQNVELAHQRFVAALQKLKSLPGVDTNKIVAVGYCFGGTQVLTMALLGEDLRAVTCFHGGLDIHVPFEKNKVKAKLLICNGAADKFVSETQTNHFKQKLDSINVAYKLNLYADALHAFTNPNATEVGKKFNMQIAYNAAADSASWHDMQQFFNETLK